jgi:archaeal preflagellin peptidase FlaK
LFELLNHALIGIWIGLAMLIVASIIDMQKREIHDYYWMVFGAIGVVLLITNPNINTRLFEVGVSLLVIPFVIVVWRIGLFGGADAFAITVLTILAPMATFSNGLVSPFTVVSNAAILFIIPLAINFFRNVVLILKHENIFDGFDDGIFTKMGAMLLGYRTKNPKFSFSIETIKDGKKKLNLLVYHAENEPYCTVPNTWVTPGIPYLLLITGGFIIQLLYGDIILSFFI